MREKIEKPKAGEFSEEYKNKLLELAELVLDEEGRDDVWNYLDGEEIENARKYLLGALDRAFAEKDISDEFAKEQYRLLGFDQEEASKIRNLSKANKRQF